MSLRFPLPRCEWLGSRVGRLLLPIDLARCPLEILPVAGRLVRSSDGRVVLLNVLDSRKARVRPGRGAERQLLRIGQWLIPEHEVSVCVRSGVPCEEIVAEAQAGDVDMILLPYFAPPLWARVLGRAYSDTVRRVVELSSARIFLAKVADSHDLLRRPV